MRWARRSAVSSSSTADHRRETRGIRCLEEDLLSALPAGRAVAAIAPRRSVVARFGTADSSAGGRRRPSLRWGPEALVTGIQACRLQGLRGPRGEADRVHLLMPSACQISSAGYVIVKRTTRMPRPVVVDWGGDGAPRPCRPQRERLNPEVLTSELAAGSDRGSALPREVLRDVVRGAQSAAEVDAMAVWRRTGLPEPLWNHELRDVAGRYIGTPMATSKRSGSFGRSTPTTSISGRRTTPRPWTETPGTPRRGSPYCRPCRAAFDQSPRRSPKSFERHTGQPRPGSVARRDPERRLLNN